MVQTKENVSLAAKTTFRIGGPARYFAEILTEDDLVEALSFAESKSLSVFVLGGGSNLLLSDAGFSGLVLHLAIAGPILTHSNLLEVPAGMEWDDLVLHVCEQGISGMECLAGIPGLVGASPIQNIGAYGQEAAEMIHHVRAYDRNRRRFVILSKEDCKFSYRQSIFNTTQRNRYIITQVTFTADAQVQANLTYPDLRSYFASATVSPSPLEVYQAVRYIRAAKGMLLVAGGTAGAEDMLSAGSFFKNPIVSPSVISAIAACLRIAEDAVPRYPSSGGKVKLPAAWLLDQAGFHKGHVDGEAGISSRHTLALINRGHATYGDIARLRDRIVETVRSRFQLTLEQEPVGF